MRDSKSKYVNTEDTVLTTHEDKQIKLSEVDGNYILLSFHPLAWTGTCASQMKSLERNYKAFRELDTVTFGISVDPVPTKKAWAEELGLENTRLVSDFWPHGDLAQKFNIFRKQDGISERANIILNKQGDILYKKIYDIGELPDMEEIISEIKGL